MAYKLIQSLTPELALWEYADQDTGHLDPVARLRTLVSHADNSSPSFQPLFLSKLPIELRFYIWEYVGLATAYSSFILVAGETTRLVRSFNCFSSRDVPLQKGSHLSVKMVSIFGTKYIQDIYIGDASETSFEILGVVTELRLAACSGGICAIDIFGAGWNTGWIGAVPNKGNVWYGMIKNAMSSLHCSFNVRLLAKH